MSDQVRDPVHRVRYSFEPDGDDLVVDTWLEPGGKLPEHFHPRQEENWCVLEGEVRMSLDGDERLLRPEDGTALVKPGARHALASTGSGEAHLRCHVHPALDLRAFLEGSAAAANEGLFARGGIPKSLRGARWAARFLKRHGDDVVMTFPPRPVQSLMIAVFGR